MAYTTINKSTDHFNTKLYTGTGAENAVTGVGFQPDFTWLKNRATTNHHTLFDAVRGANKVIYSNLDAIQYTVTQELKSFDSDGFTVGTEASANGSGNGIVSWNWKAGGAGSSNTDGSITSTVSANTTSGFSIVKWTGTSANATIGHGLGAVPKMIIIKSLANTSYWMVYHSSLGNNSEIYLNRGDYGASASSTAWQDTDPTSSVFYVGGGSGDGVNVSGDYIAYCFAEKTGFSKFSSYIGNGNADGPMIYTGFKPAFIMTKRAVGGTDSWFINDIARATYNPSQQYMRPNETSAEGTSTAHQIDILSNAFKIRSTDTAYNTSGNTYIFMAFAEAPLVGSNNVPCTAR